MQTYNQINQGNIMPLLMNFTTPVPVQEADDIKFTYNDGEQISYEMRVLGTKSLRTTRTQYDRNYAGHPLYRSDRANVMDDSKTVK